jgi:anaerobic selenocysteine-containing dehydrogenase
MSCLAEEIETTGTGQVRALITVASNPVLSAPNGERLAKALDSLDFMVSMDIYVNETTRHADVILPGVSPLEDQHYDVPFPQFSWRNHARYSEPVFPLPDNLRPEWTTMLKLAAIASGQGTQADPYEMDAALFGAEAVKLNAFPDMVASTAHLSGPDRLLDASLTWVSSSPEFQSCCAHPAEQLNWLRLC